VVKVLKLLIQITYWTPLIKSYNSTIWLFPNFWKDKRHRPNE